jgi:hypothetical protein
MSLITGVLSSGDLRDGGATLSQRLAQRLGPGKWQMDVVRDEKAPTWGKAAAIGRLPLQLPMIRIAQKAARG